MPNVSPAPHGCHSSTVSMGTESPHTAGGNHRAVGAQQPQLFGILSIPTQKTQKAPPLLLPSVPPIKTAMCGVRKAAEGPAHLPCEPTLTHCSHAAGAEESNTRIIPCNTDSWKTSGASLWADQVGSSLGLVNCEFVTCTQTPPDSSTPTVKASRGCRSSI